MPNIVVAVSFAGNLPPTPQRSDREEGQPRESGWQSLSDPTDLLVLLGFGSEAAANEDLRRLVEADEPLRPDAPLPVAVRHVVIAHEHGVVLDKVPIGGYLAIAQTIANPGYGYEAGEQLEETVSTFAQLPGYCGHLQGHLEAVEEEALAFVFGTDRSNAPLPLNLEASVQLYRRVA